MFRPVAAFFRRPIVWGSLVVFGSLYDLFGRTAFNLWQENWLIDHGAAKGPPAGMTEALSEFAATTIVPWLAYLTDSFGLGLLVGGAVFALPDILRALRHRRPTSGARESMAAERAIEIPALRKTVARLLDLLADTSNVSNAVKEIDDLSRALRGSDHPVWENLEIRALRHDFVAKILSAMTPEAIIGHALGNSSRLDQLLSDMNKIAVSLDKALLGYGEANGSAGVR